MKLISKSSPCCKSELDLFYSPPTNTSILSSAYTTVSSKALDGSEESFEIGLVGNSSYVDLNDIYLILEVSITKNGAKMGTSDKIAPVNNLAHSIFKRIDLSIGRGLTREVVEVGNSNYSYKAYFLNLFNFGDAAEQSWLQSGLFYKDEAEKFDLLESDEITKVSLKTESSNTTAQLVKPDFNSGFVKRRNEFLRGKGTVKMITPLHCDFLHSNRFLVNDIGLYFEFFRNSNKFLLMGLTGYELNILKASLTVRKCVINDQVKLAHIQALQLEPFKYPIKQNRVFVELLPQGSQQYTATGFNTKIPNKIIVGILKDETFNGAFDKNPFNFSHNGVTSVTLIVDETKTTIKIDADKNDFIEGYHALCECLNLYGQNGNNISKNDYLNGYCFFCFNLTADKGCEGQYNLLKEGLISIEIEFKETTDKNHKLICFSEYDNQININRDLEIYFDYKH